MLIIVTGPPASGKTFVAEGLARALSLPLIAKDDIKVILFDTLGHDTPEQSSAYGLAAINLLSHIARQILGAGQSCIVECNFRPDLAVGELGEIQRETGCELIQVHVSAPADILLERFQRRWREGRRHPGHHDDTTLGRVEAALREDAFGVIDLECTLIQADTANFGAVDVQAIADQIRARLPQE